MRKLCTTLLASLLLSACSNNQQLPADNLIAYPGYTGEYDGFTLVLDDRFDVLQITEFFLT